MIGITYKIKTINKAADLLYLRYDKPTNKEKLQTKNTNYKTKIILWTDS